MIDTVTPATPAAVAAAVEVALPSAELVIAAPQVWRSTFAASVLTIAADLLTDGPVAVAVLADSPHSHVVRTGTLLATTDDSLVMTGVFGTIHRISAEDILAFAA